ncbi:MAG TPA: type IX secretion system membrane protein PorP/SprF [Bacteroidia bacterium]|nr:type IX secretion system membrane protein PorP/SprF [Bacteroidia bacterium]
MRIFYSRCCFFLILFVFCSVLRAQQIPYYTQFPNYYVAYNPAFAGTKKNINMMVDYRNQWVGFEGAPVTQGFYLDSRFMKGMMGAAGSVVSDETGPYKRIVYALSYAFHIHFPDFEISLGAQGSMNKTFWDARLVSVHNSGDPAVDRSMLDYKWIPNASAGVLIYNDRFHFGLSMLNMIGDHANYYKGDPGHAAKITVTPNYYFTVGYNFSENPDFIWQNSLIAMYATSSPINIEYNLKLHMKKSIFIGADIRIKDAIALQAGVTIIGKMQIGYSYDIVTFPIGSYQKGTHEITLAYKSNLERDRKYNRNNDFVHQRYYLF